MDHIQVSSRHLRRQAMQSLIEAWLAEPTMSQRDFCSRHNIVYATFQYHLAKYRRQQIPVKAPSEPRFIPLTLPAPPISEEPASACEVSWPDGLIIRFASIPAADYLARLLQAMSLSV